MILVDPDKVELSNLNRQGITSTYVENTLVPLRFCTRNFNHLHIRGEYSSQSTKLEWSAGSPPHTWRIRSMVSPFYSMAGITSTYVENTTFRMLIPRVAKDHLHIRGEYAIQTLPQVGMLESPPHTWRIRRKKELGYRPARITSTYVENT